MHACTYACMHTCIHIIAAAPDTVQTGVSEECSFIPMVSLRRKTTRTLDMVKGPHVHGAQVAAPSAVDARECEDDEIFQDLYLGALDTDDE